MWGQQTDRILKEAVNELVMLKWASPTFFAPTTDRRLRFCVHYKELKAMTVRDTHPLPQMKERIDCLGKAAIFSTLNCNSGYSQTEVPEADRDKATISSHHDLSRIIRMPLGLEIAPASVQRVVDTTL